MLGPRTRTLSAGAALLLLQGLAPAPSAHAGECVYVANRGSDYLSVIDAHNRRVVAELATDGAPVAMASGAAMRALYVAAANVTADSTSAGLSAIEPSTGRSLHRIPLEAAPLALALSPDERIAYVAFINRIAFIDLASGTVLATVPTGGSITAFGSVEAVVPPLALSPDGTRLFFPLPRLEAATLGVIDTASAIRTATLTLVPELDFPDATGMAIGPDGRFGYVLLTSGGGLVPVLDLETSSAAGAVQLGSCAPAALQVSPAGDRLIAVDQCAVLHSVDLAAGAIERYALDMPRGRVNLAVSESSAYVVHYDFDAVSIIDPATGRREATIPVGPQPRDVVVLETDGACAPGGQPPRPTPTSAPVSTPAPTPTPVLDRECPPNVPCVEVRAAAGRPGDARNVELYLHTAGRKLAGVQTDLSFDARSISLDGCRSGDGLGSLGFTQIREGVLRGILVTPDQAVIPDGAMLQACTATVHLDASPGVTSLRVTNLVGTDPRGTRVDIVGTAADLPILASATHPLSGDGATGRSSTAGCHVTPESQASLGWLTLIALLIPGWLRRLTRIRSE